MIAFIVVGVILVLIGVYVFGLAVQPVPVRIVIGPLRLDALAVAWLLILVGVALGFSGWRA